MLTNSQINDDRLKRVSIWNLSDVLLVSFFTLTASIIIYLPLRLLINDKELSFKLAWLVGSFVEMALPIYWIKNKYSFPSSVLGITKGVLPLPKIILLGLGFALSYYIIFHLLIFGFTSSPKTWNVSWVQLIFLPFSFVGFELIISSPVGEEILYRGFIYGYLRNRFGIFWGLNTQALLFSTLHLVFLQPAGGYLILDKYLIGLILGVLYERAKSLYPCMICHAGINYMSYFFNIL